MYLTSAKTENPATNLRHLNNVDNQICQILQNLQGHLPKFSKLQEALWLTVINQLLKFRPC